MDLKRMLKKKKELIDEYLKLVLPYAEGPQKLHEATWYAMLNGGKRLRAIIMLAIAEMKSQPLEIVLNSAAGIEMIHTSTLLLDDLPSMDDALLRRGKPALHKVYGEATAILVAESLLLEGLNLIVAEIINNVSPQEERNRLIRNLFSSLGKDGVMLGQFLDLYKSNQELKLKEIEEIHAKKTGSLFESSVDIASTLAGFTLQEKKEMMNFATCFGKAFQISDDLIAVENKPALSGKLSLTKDRRPNYVQVCGKKKALKNLNDYIQKAIGSLKKLPRSEFLIELTKYLKTRNN
jgi:geranylgeranyl diphosphate synthase type II